MFFSIPGFDPKSLTNDQLFEKQLELTKRRIQSSRFGKAEVMAQITMMLDAIDQERQERMFNDVFGKAMIETQGVVVETDPDIRKQMDDEVKEEDVRQEKAKHPIRRPMRSFKPVKSSTDTGGI